ncbi:MAG: citrate transporter [Ignavibacteriales bacterium CG_4_9_14_3_um_filter_30_11]|nr:MAG: citrate transporter [Ignavibacteriales bacterium CG_4_9_14_3_um_filter_30_11]
MFTNKKFFFFSLFLLLGTLFSINLFAAGSTVIASETESVVTPSIYMLLPFVILLILIATGPLFYKHFWERHYPKISILLGLVTVVYYVYFLKDYHSVIHIFIEYVSFIALLSSLFVASGGILIKIDREATPIANILFLLFGAVIANVIGTTGASMLLIRPFIKMNKDRIKPYHIIFFIFLVSNVGGALTPIGDPPLFIGFLRGVPFLWVIENVWYIWIPTLLIILLVFYIIDKNNHSKLETTEAVEYSGKIEFKGVKNLIYLVVIIVAVFIDPGIMSWVPSLKPLPFGIREIIMFGVVFLSYNKAHPDILKANEFDFEPIKEVAYLFVGIFLTMIPALQLIAIFSQQNHDMLHATSFYWATGILSSALDNTPTYLNFLSAAMGKFYLDVNVKSQVIEFIFKDDIFLRAISVSAVFFGAMTYIGNGPNFMVKSISERAGIEMPSFFAYLIKYAIPILIPIYTIIWLIYFS